VTPRLALTLLSVLLLVFIGAEWLVPENDDVMSWTAGSPSANVTASATMAQSVLALGPDGLVAKTLARPLFLPGRRIPVIQPPPPIAPVVKPDPVPRLMGVFTMSGTKIAIFQIIGQIKPVDAGVGQKVGDWTVSAITQNNVTITGADGPQTIAPSADPNDVNTPDENGPPPDDGQPFAPD